MAKKYKSKDLAARLGISATVVSLVLNNKGDKYGVKKDTQERILNLAEQMGFFAQSSDSADSKPAFPVEDKPGIAGMITPSLNDPFVVQITPLLQSAFASIGIGFSVISKDTDDQRFGRMLSALRKNYSGLILLGDSADDTTIRSLKAGDYPFIILEKTVKTLRLNTIATDTAAGASAVMSHIEKLGYKNIIIVDDRRANTAYARPADEIVSIIDKTEGMKQPETIEIDKTFTGSDTDFAKFEKLDASAIQRPSNHRYQRRPCLPHNAYFQEERHPHTARYCPRLNGRRHRLRPYVFARNRIAKKHRKHSTESGKHALERSKELRHRKIQTSGCSASRISHS